MCKSYLHGIYRYTGLYLPTNIYLRIAKAITRFLARDSLQLWDIAFIHSLQQRPQHIYSNPFLYATSPKQPPLLTLLDPPVNINPQPPLTPPSRRRSHRTRHHWGHRSRMTHREPIIRHLTKPFSIILTARRSWPALSSTYTFISPALPQLPQSTKEGGMHSHCPQCPVHTLAAVDVVAAAVLVEVASVVGASVVGATVVDSTGEGEMTLKHCE